MKCAFPNCPYAPAHKAASARSQENSAPRVVVATDRQLSSRPHFQRLSMATARLNLPRRELPDWIADRVYTHLNKGGEIVWPNGKPFELSDSAIDEAFGDDGSFRWISDFVRFAEEPPKQRPQSRVLSRLRLIDLAFRIKTPSAAQKIAR